MNQIKTIAYNFTDNQDTKHTVFFVLTSSLIVLSMVYVYLIGSITFNVLARKTLEKQFYAIGSNVSFLELTYLDDVNKIDKNYAMSLGYKDTKAVLFAHRGSGSNVALR